VETPNSAARVGIVVRTKNRPWFLRRTLTDISAQDFADWRVQVVNDGGDPQAVDDALALLPASSRDRVSVTHHAASQGRSAAANAGLAALRTEFVVLHDDDDLWAPTFLSATVTWLDAHAADVGVMVRTDIVYEVARDGGYVEVDRAKFWPQVTEITYSDLLQVNRAVPIAYLYRREIHAELGGYREDLHAVEDWEFYLRTTLKHHIGLLDGPPLAFWTHRVGASGDESNSMFALAGEHERYDKLVRDEALRAYVTDFGPGLPLYLTRFVQDEVARQLAQRVSLSTHLLDRVRRWRHRRRGR
jgi:glycosyltransferase involved in cell wall biosynthesis